MPSTSPPRDTSAVKAAAFPPSPEMILTFSPAAAPLRSTQNTCAPSRANVTAVALPLPQPGPIEPAPTTIAVLPLSRGIEISCYELVGDSTNCRHSGMRLLAQARNPYSRWWLWIPGSRSARPGMTASRITSAHCRNIRADPKPENLRQRPALAVRTQPPFAGGAGIAQHNLGHRRTFRLPLKPAIDQPRVRWRLHAGAGAFYARLDQFEAVGADAPVF